MDNKKLVSSKTNAPEGYKVNPLFIEKRSKRTQLIMQPSVFERAKAKAEQNGQSFNDYVHSLIEKDLDGGDGA